ncbi:MAG: undecaprenyl-diphosphatase UppP [Thermoleophilia bacterium]
MNILQAIVLGIVQGLTEFLPVSSSAHLVLVPDVLGWDLPSTSFDIVLHLGTMVAVVAYFWRDIVEMAASFFQRDRAALARRRLGLLLIIGTIPAAVIGALFQKKFEDLFSEPAEVALFLIITGVLLVASEAVARRNRHIKDLSVTDSVLIGAAQAVAIAPGISRSGATISTGLFLGLTREAAARYSFLLSIPIIAGAAVLKLRHGFEGGNGETAGTLIFGFLAAVVSGFAAIRFLLGYVRRHNLRIFALYCWVVGGGVLLWKLIG